MVQQSSWSANQQVDSLFKSDAFSLPVHSSNKKSDSFIMEMAQLLGNFIDLNGKFSGRGNDDDSSAILLLKFKSPEQFKAWDQVCQCFT